MASLGVRQWYFYASFECDWEFQRGLISLTPEFSHDVNVIK